MRLNCAWLLALAARLRLCVLRPHAFNRMQESFSLSVCQKKPRCFSPNSPKTKSTCSEDDSMVFVARFICEFLPQHAPPHLTTQLFQESAGTCPVCTSLGGTGSTTAVAVTSVRAAGGSLGDSPCCCGACVTHASWCCRASN